MKDIVIFTSYSHIDKPLKDEILTHLSFLNQIGSISDWNDSEITDWIWKDLRNGLLNTAQIILLFISPDYLTSTFSYSNEMKQAIERHNTGKAIVIPIILCPCDWHNSPFGMLPALPENDKPVTTWSNRDEAIIDIVQGIQKAVKSLNAFSATNANTQTSVPSPIELSIQQGDVTSFDADVVALKYAQEFYGADKLIARLLRDVGIEDEKLRPTIGEYRYIETKNCIRAPHVLFVGVPSIINFDYQYIQTFSTSVLEILSKEEPNTKHLAMTVHGVGFGLDEIEAFLAQFAGFLSAMQKEQLPSNLQYITIIEKNVDRVQRLRQALDEYLAQADYAYPVRTRSAYILDRRKLNTIFKNNHVSTKAIEGAGTKSEAKRHVFVAMPFKKDMDDVFFYGIQKPVRAAGLLCERIDQEAFVGDILDQVKKKIETAVVVIAELSDANPNVYLEVGYAWGKDRPTILLVKIDQELRFDVRGQKCLKYERIMDLEESLKRELKELKIQRLI